jgi:hypothetical protein
MSSSLIHTAGRPSASRTQTSRIQLPQHPRGPRRVRRSDRRPRPRRGRLRPSGGRRRGRCLRAGGRRPSSRWRSRRRRLAPERPRRSSTQRRSVRHAPFYGLRPRRSGVNGPLSLRQRQESAHELVEAQLARGLPDLPPQRPRRARL